MILLVDAGNSRLKWALRDEAGALSGFGDCPLRRDPNAAVRTLMHALTDSVDRVLVANVAGPWVADALRRAGRRVCAAEVEFVATAAEAYGVRCAYEKPARLGVDRWVGVIAAHARGRGPSLVVDVGTAVTLDAVCDGRHEGGLILPGLELMARSLQRDTADIGRAQLGRRPGHGTAALGRSTDEAVAYGSIWALAGAVERVRAEYRGAVSADPVVYLTGGGAALLADYLPVDVQRRPHLVLEGLAHMAG